MPNGPTSKASGAPTQRWFVLNVTVDKKPSFRALKPKTPNPKLETWQKSGTRKRPLQWQRTLCKAACISIGFLEYSGLRIAFEDLFLVSTV